MRRFLTLALAAVLFLGLSVLPAKAEGEVAIEV